MMRNLNIRDNYCKMLDRQTVSYSQKKKKLKPNNFSKCLRIFLKTSQMNFARVCITHKCQISNEIIIMLVIRIQRFAIRRKGPYFETLKICEMYFFK